MILLTTAQGNALIVSACEVRPNFSRDNVVTSATSPLVFTSRTSTRNKPK